MQLTRISRKYATINLTATDATGQPANVGEVSIALLAPGTRPSAGTQWTPVPAVDGARKVLLVGPDADPSGGFVVASAVALWARATDSPEVDAVMLETIRVT